MKLIKSTKTVKLPKISGSVQSAIERATYTAKQQKWNRIIIIGEGPEGGGTYRSRMSSHVAISLCEIAKAEEVKDMIS